MFRIEDSTLTHVDQLSKTMRDTDVQEIWRAGRSLPYTSLSQGLDGDKCLTLLKDDDVICMYGTYSTIITRPQAAIWLLGSDLVHAYPKQFWLATHGFMEWAKIEYDELFNYIDAENIVTLPWIARLGFEIEDPVPYGPFGHPFRFIYWSSG